MTEPFSKSVGELRDWDVEVWKHNEALIPKNSGVLAKLIGIHYDLLVRMHQVDPEHRQRGMERALRSMAAKCTHTLRAMWVSIMAGYPGARHPLARALYETALQMYYLRQHPDEYDLWCKVDKSAGEQRRFWPSRMMKRLELSEEERKIYSVLADAAHPNVTSLSGLGAYDSEGDALELSIGRVLTVEEARHSSLSVCLLAAISAFNIARTVKNALADELPNEEELQEFLRRLTDLTSGLEREPVQGTAAYDVFKERT